MHSSFKYNEIKGTLAKLLAAENLIVEHCRCETASFDVDKRILKLPMWDATDRVYNCLVGHEVGHALFTPNEEWADAKVPQSYINVTEDARIEKLMKRKFPGLQKDFYQGYQQLNESDFFGIQDIKIESLKLIDRINLYYKVGAYSLIPFNDAEIPLRDAVGATETFGEAIQAAVTIYKYENQTKQEKIDTVDAGQTDTEDDQLDDLPGSNAGPAQEGPEGEEEPLQQESQPEPVSEGDVGESTDENKGMGGSQGTDEAITDKNLSDSLKNIQGGAYADVDYLEIDDIKIDDVVVSPHRIHQETVDFYSTKQFTDTDDDFYIQCNWTYTDSLYKKFKRDCSREVNYLVKEFEMKKSAAAYSRETVARTGVIDTNKLNSYLWNEDLFKKVTVKPDGKNHGLIFLLDWSGSMSSCLLDTYKQVLSLCLFCRRVGIPFDVLAFVTDATWNTNGIDPDYTGRPGTLHIPEHFHLLNFLSSSLNNQQFDTYALEIWRTVVVIDSRYGSMYSRDWEAYQQVPDRIPPHMQLGGTPLNEAIACLKTIVPAFQRKHGVEKCHVSILSDGEACWSGKWRETTYNGDTRVHRASLSHNTQLRDRKSGKIFKVDTRRPRFTKQLLQYLKGMYPQCNFLGFRIASSRDVTQYLGMELVGAKYAAAHREWIRNKTVSAPILGYQEIYFFSEKNLNTEVEFDVKEDATKGQIRTAFKKSLKGKANNKKILSSFISQIA